MADRPSFVASTHHAFQFKRLHTTRQGLSHTPTLDPISVPSGMFSVRHIIPHSPATWTIHAPVRPPLHQSFTTPQQLASTPQAPAVIIYDPSGVLPIRSSDELEAPAPRVQATAAKQERAADPAETFPEPPPAYQASSSASGSHLPSYWQYHQASLSRRRFRFNLFDMVLLLLVLVNVMVWTVVIVLRIIGPDGAA